MEISFLKRSFCFFQERFGKAFHNALHIVTKPLDTHTPVSNTTLKHHAKNILTLSITCGWTLTLYEDGRCDACPSTCSRKSSNSARLSGRADEPTERKSARKPSPKTASLEARLWSPMYI